MVSAGHLGRKTVYRVLFLVGTVLLFISVYIRDLLALVSVAPSVPLLRPGKLYCPHGNMSLDQESVGHL